MSLDFLAGCVGGIAGIFVGHPLDTVKVLMQIQDVSNPRYKGTLHCIKSLVARGGIRGLYKGVTSPVVGVAGINAIVFGVYGNVQRRLPDKDSLKAHAIAGGIAGAVQSVVASPVELVKSRMQAAENCKQTTWGCLRRIYTEGGVKGVYKGFSITALREIPGFGSYFFTYELLTRTEGDKPVSTANMLFAGGAAGVVSWTLSYPIDTIKTKLQTCTAGQYTGMVDCFNKILKSEGYKGFFRGLSPTLIRAFPVNAVTFTVVTWTLRLVDDERMAQRTSAIIDIVYGLKGTRELESLMNL